MSCGGVFLPTGQCSSSLLLLLTLPQHPSQSPSTSIFATLSYSSSSYLHSCSRMVTCRCRRWWDSDVDSFRSRDFNDFDSKFQRTSSENGFDDSYDEEEEVYASSDQDQWLDLLEQFIDGVYIFKAFRSIGWLSPAIIISWLVATGPKATLMAFALSLGQSAFLLVIHKLMGKKWTIPKRNNTKTRKKSRYRTSRNVSYEKDRKRKKGYQSWVAGNKVAVDKNGQSSYNFGGWDELDKQTEINMTSVGSSAATGRTQARQSTEREELRRAGRSETPLLLRLLIAFFPLSSWTKML